MTRPETQDRRKPEVMVSERLKVKLVDRISLMLVGFQFTDIISSRKHSDDFSSTRAHFTLARLRLMAIIFGIFVPLSCFIDFIVLETAQAVQMLYVRLLLSAALLLLAKISRKQSVRMTFRCLLPAGFILPTLFYVAANVIVLSQGHNMDAAGYDFMPYLIIVMLALFPVTLGQGLVITLIVFIPFIIIEYLTNSLLTPAALNSIWAFSMIASISIWLQLGQLAMLMKLYRESTLDPLTGLSNRRVLMKRVDKEIASRNSFYVLMFDLDKFKRINDTYGHLSGDHVLVAIAQIIKAEMRKKDIVARFGGEEFIAILCGISEKDAIMTAERIRQRCEAQVITTVKGESIIVTTSIGVTRHQLDDDFSQTLNRVDDLLYQSKSQGRNRVVGG